MKESDGKKDMHIGMIKKTLDKHNGKNNRKRKGQKRHSLPDKVSTVQKQQTQKNRHKKHGEASLNEGHRNRRYKVKKLRKRVKSGKPASVCLI